MACVCISVISGYSTPRRHPLKPSIGFTSSRDFTFSASSSTGIFKSLLTISCWYVFFGRNSWRGGSSKRTVTGRPSIALKIPKKSSRCIGSSLLRAALRPFSLSARIISRMDVIRSPSKNICSVRHSPMPTAPKPRAVLASFGVSAFVRTFKRAYLSASAIRSEKSPPTSAACISSLPR